MPTSVKTKGMASFFTGLLKGIGESRYKQYLQDLQEKSRLQEVEQGRLTEISKIAASEMVDPETPPEYRQKAAQVYNEAVVNRRVTPMPSRPDRTIPSLKDQLLQKQIEFYDVKGRTEEARQNELNARATKALRWKPILSGGANSPYAGFVNAINAKQKELMAVSAQIKQLQKDPFTGEILPEAQKQYSELITQQEELVGDIENYSSQIDAVNPYFPKPATNVKPGPWNK